MTGSKKSTLSTLGGIALVGGIVGFYAAVAIPSFTRARLRASCSTVLGQCRQTDAAKDQYALENNKAGTMTPDWADLTPYLKAGSFLAMNGGNDSFGNPFIIGPVNGSLYVNPKTMEACKYAAPPESGFWGPYNPHTLVAAVSANDGGLLKQFIAEGVDSKTKGSEALVLASKNGQTTFIELLVANGADVNANGNLSRRWQSKSIEGATVLHDRAPPGDSVWSMNGVAGHSYGGDERNRWFETPLIVASESGQLQTVRLLLKHGADPNREHGRALMLARENGYTDVADLLVKAGAKPDDLLIAAEFGDTETVNNLLAAGADINMKDETGRTPLIRAILDDHNDLALALIAKGADVSVKDMDGRTALKYSTIFYKTPIAEALKKAGAKD